MKKNCTEKRLIDKYLELGWKIYPVKPEERNLLSDSYTSNFSDRYIKDYSELDNFNPETTLLGLDLENSGLTCICVELTEIQIVFRDEEVKEFRDMLIKLFTSPAPCFWDERREAFRLLFKGITREELKNSYFKDIGMGGIGCISQESTVIPHILSPNFHYRSSWLFPERNIMKLKPCKFNSREIFNPDLALKTNNISTDDPKYYNYIINSLPKSIRKLLGF